MKKILLSLLLSVMLVNQFGFLHTESRQLLAEINGVLEQDPDLKQRMALEDESMKYYYDMIERSKIIAQKESMFDKLFAYFFYNMFPGAPLSAVFEGLVHLPAEKIPQLHALVKELAQKYNMPTPPIFLAGQNKLFNAAATSFVPSSAMVILGKKLLEEMTDEELKAVLAHELSHVKNSHVLKNLALISAFLATGVVLWHYASTWMFNEDKSFGQTLYSIFVPRELAHVLEIDKDRVNQELVLLGGVTVFLVVVATIIAKVSRMHEEQADRDAMRVTGDPAAFAASMKFIKKHVETKIEKLKEEQQFLHTKVDELELQSPWLAGWARSSIDNYVTDTIETLEASIDQDAGSHPSLNRRIAYGEEQEVSSREAVESEPQLFIKSSCQDSNLPIKLVQE